MKLKRLPSVLIQLFISFAIIFTLSTCKKKTDETQPTTDPVVIASNAKFIVDSDWQSIVVDSSDYTFTMNQGVVDKYSLVTGDLIVSSKGNGILRKIDTIIQSGTHIQIQTSQATLVNLIRQGSIDYRTTLSSSKIKSIKYYYPGISLDTSSIKSTDGTVMNWNINTEIAPQIWLQGNLEYTTDFVFQIQISLLEGLKQVKFGIEGNEVFNLSLVAGKQFTLDKEILLTQVYFTPVFIPIAVPPFVIVIAPVLDIKVGVGGYANATISTSLSQTVTIETGIQYIKEEGWSNYMNFDKSLNYTPPQLNMNAGAEAFVKPELSMLIFNIAGPYFNAKGYGRIQADLTLNPWWKMYYGVKMAAGVKATILDIYTLDYSVEDLLNWEQQVGQYTGSNIDNTTWDVLLVLSNTNQWHADVTFRPDGTTKYDEPAFPGVYTTYGIWSINNNLIHWTMGMDPNYIFDGTVTGNTMSGTFVYGGQTHAWSAVKRP